MLLYFFFKGNPLQFRDLVSDFDTDRHMEFGPYGEPSYEVVSEDEYRVEVRFRDGGFKPVGTWGTVTARAIGDTAMSRLTVQASKDILADVEGAWRALYDFMMVEGVIEPVLLVGQTQKAQKAPERTRHVWNRNAIDKLLAGQSEDVVKADWRAEYEKGNKVNLDQTSDGVDKTWRKRVWEPYQKEMGKRAKRA